MIVKYRTKWNEIERVEIFRETDNFVYFGNGCREAKRSGFQNYFDTWEDAKAFLLDEAQKSIDAARRELQRAQAEYGNIKGMKNPEAS